MNIAKSVLPSPSEDQQINQTLERAHALYEQEHERQLSLFCRQYGQRPAYQQDGDIVHSRTLKALGEATRRLLGFY